MPTASQSMMEAANVRVSAPQTPRRMAPLRQGPSSKAAGSASNIPVHINAPNIPEEVAMSSKRKHGETEEAGAEGSRTKKVKMEENDAEEDEVTRDLEAPAPAPRRSGRLQSAASGVAYPRPLPTGTMVQIEATPALPDTMAGRATARHRAKLAADRAKYERENEEADQARAKEVLPKDLAKTSGIPEHIFTYICHRKFSMKIVPRPDATKIQAAIIWTERILGRACTHFFALVANPDNAELQAWVNGIRELLLLAGTSCDLTEEARVVRRKEAKRRLPTNVAAGRIITIAYGIRRSLLIRKKGDPAHVRLDWQSHFASALCAMEEVAYAVQLKENRGRDMVRE